MLWVKIDRYDQNLQNTTSKSNRFGTNFFEKKAGLDSE